MEQSNVLRVIFIYFNESNWECRTDEDLGSFRSICTEITIHKCLDNLINMYPSEQYHSAE